MMPILIRHSSRRGCQVDFPWVCMLTSHWQNVNGKRFISKLGGFTFLLFSLAIKAKLDNFSCDFIQSSSDSMCSCITGFVFIVIMTLDI